MTAYYEDVASKLDRMCAERDLGGFYAMISPWMKAIETLGKNTKAKRVRMRKSDLTLEDMQRLALEFYADLGLDFEEKISRIVMDKATIIRTAEPSEKGGAMAVGLHSQKDGTVAVEIDLHPRNTINGGVTVAHEFGHMLGQRIQQKVVPKTDCLGEIETMFFEQIFIDWLFEKGKITEEDRAILRQQRLNNLDSEIHKLLTEKQILDSLGTPISAKKLQHFDEEFKNAGKNDARKFFERQISDMISNPDLTGEYMFRYVFGEVVARAMYAEYQKNPEQTLQRLSSYLKHSEEYDFGMRKTWQDGRCRTPEQVNVEEIKSCLTELLGENSMQKISNVINPEKKNDVSK